MLEMFSTSSMTILRITLDDFTKMGNKDLYTPCPNIKKKNILVKKQLQQSLINDKQQISSSGFQQAMIAQMCWKRG